MHIARARILAALTTCALMAPAAALPQTSAEVSSEIVTATTLQAPDLFSAGGQIGRAHV